VETILAEAGRWDAEVIALGSHGRRALGRVLLGCASEGVLPGSRCPVRILPAPR